MLVYNQEFILNDQLVVNESYTAYNNGIDVDTVLNATIYIKRPVKRSTKAFDKDVT